MQFVVVKRHHFRCAGVGEIRPDKNPLFFGFYYASYGLQGPILTLVVVDSMLVARFEP